LPVIYLIAQKSRAIQPNALPCVNSENRTARSNLSRSASLPKTIYSPEEFAGKQAQ
jgi:hypothetical protein